ncbi:hypothetical protein ElyMa_003351600 [Elysia marginata]|uniref:DUF4773 domain-containing protein n=1 Tax=Elysia marginata TaxID=1093978 RepID=A0AAV4JN26_9GAST|nr:hypothetical protein ElyMa_003351600 [Elysia marginata]
MVGITIQYNIAESLAKKSVFGLTKQESCCTDKGYVCYDCLCLKDAFACTTLTRCHPSSKSFALQYFDVQSGGLYRVVEYKSDLFCSAIASHRTHPHPPVQACWRSIGCVSDGCRATSISIETQATSVSIELQVTSVSIERQTTSVSTTHQVTPDSKVKHSVDDA